MAEMETLSIQRQAKELHLIWLGQEYLLSHPILILLLVNAFIMLSRGAVDTFNTACGNYHDTWSAWVEGIINISVTIFSCIQWGLAGVLIGSVHLLKSS